MPGTDSPNAKPAGFIVETPTSNLPVWAERVRRTQRIESFPPDGHPTWVELPARADLAAERMATWSLPVGARAIPYFDPTGEPSAQTVVPTARTITRILLLSEAYDGASAASFFQHCETAAAALLGAKPFNHHRDTIRIDGLFVPLEGSEVVDIQCRKDALAIAMLKPTLFATQSCLDGQTSHLWGGDEDRARDLVGRMLAKHVVKDVLGADLNDYRFIIVLINSAEYGGAGSVGGAPRVCWATSRNAASIGVLLHELGHAFGLQDEYGGTETDARRPSKPWRNISIHAVPAATPWATRVNTDPNQLTHAADAGPWQGSASTVGTFQGAGYFDGLRYRPSHDCRMRTTATPFCDVCAAVIAEQLDPTAPSGVGRES